MLSQQNGEISNEPLLVRNAYRVPVFFKSPELINHTAELNIKISQSAQKRFRFGEIESLLSHAALEPLMLFLVSINVARLFLIFLRVFVVQLAICGGSLVISFYLS